MHISVDSVKRLKLSLKGEIMEMDLQKALSVPKNFDEEVSVKSTSRIHYEAQAKVIQKQLGSLEEIRSNLGLSQRKICQLLLVDPSAWTRWMKSGEAPPHIWRALQWYSALQEKIPGLTPNYFLGPFSTGADREKFAGKMKDEIQILSGKWEQIQKTQEKRIETLEKKLIFMKFSLIFISVAAGFMAAFFGLANLF